MKDMELHPYHPHLIHALSEDDFDRRVEFAETWLRMLHNDPQLERHIVWSDETKFHVSGSVNRHNAVYWRLENPNITIEHDHKSPGIMTWGAVTYDGLIGPFFFEENVNANSYLDLLENKVGPVIQGRNDFGELWWQQDGHLPITPWLCVNG